MLRMIAVACAVLTLVIVVGDATSVAQQKNQMVKGTIKVVDLDKSVLIINQKVKNEVVDRELSIVETTAFVVTGPQGKKEANGKAGLELLKDAAGSQVQVKCDKDVNVLKVTVMRKK